MKTKFRRSIALLASMAMWGTMLLQYPSSAFAADGVAIDATNFPDKHFRSVLSNNFDLDSDGVLDDDEIAAVTELNFRSLGNISVADLTGIEYFTELTTLNCASCNLSTLNLRRNTKLVNVNCNSNYLTSLNVTGCTALEELVCSYNSLTKINLRRNANLKSLDMERNKLTELDLSGNPLLMELVLNYNTTLTVLDLSRNPELETVKVNNCALERMELTANNKLQDFYCKNNRIAYIAGVPATIDTFDGSGQIAPLEVFTYTAPAAMTVDGVDYEAGDVITLEDDDAFSYESTNVSGVFRIGLPLTAENFPDEKFREYLVRFDLNSDRILSDKEISAVTSINVSGRGVDDMTGLAHFPNLEYLNCKENQMPALDVSQNPKLTELECSKNQLTVLDLSRNPLL